MLVLDLRVNHTVSGMATALGVRIGRIAHHPAVRLDLAREHEVVVVPAAAKIRSHRLDLPRRGRARRRPRRGVLAGLSAAPA